MKKYFESIGSYWWGFYFNMLNDHQAFAASETPVTSEK